MLDSVSAGLSELVIALRLVLAAGLGGVIGFERERRDRPAAVRTHMLTALAIFTILTFEIHAGLHQRRSHSRHRSGDRRRRLPVGGCHLQV